MNSDEIQILEHALAKNERVFWMQNTTIFPVRRVGPHPQEGDDEPCALFDHGTYAVLYNCELRDFIVVTSLVPGLEPIKESVLNYLAYAKRPTG